MSTLKVPGAQLYYEVTGSGPLLILIPGASGVGEVFRQVARELAARYQVVTYDRRGFSRSQLNGPQDYDHRLSTDADDVWRLIEHLTDKPATVFGNSSGAIVALEVLIHAPKRLQTVVGAAGGLGYGAVAFLGAQLRRGIEIVLDMTGFDAAARKADLIITGEGHLDGQSAQGKLIQGLCGRSQGTPVIALCGKLSAAPDQIKAIGLKAAYCINREEKPLAEMLANTAANLEMTASQLAI